MVNKKIVGLIAASTAVVGGLAVYSADHYSYLLKNKFVETKVVSVIVTPTASPSATVAPTLVVVPTKGVYRFVSPTKELGR